jgi:hypothetical protein
MIERVPRDELLIAVGVQAIDVYRNVAGLDSCKVEGH